MISNEYQLIITTNYLTQFQDSLTQLKYQDVSQFPQNQQSKHQLFIDALSSQIESLKSEISQYNSNASKSTL